eukprot:TRINITY_DN15109_c0_g1_i1.p1 TRINITY_DN15109_c0_g1~~TRINITY_DN15109_c0_g1_i1.p1  ORF type:complete len:371 (+),score=82.63 TRINITY_DN15109_c0_g1_i1:118-1113(+)
MATAADPYCDWNFDSLELREDGRVAALMRMATALGIPAKLRLEAADEHRLEAYLTDCLAQMPDHPFHGPEHAFDVTQFAYTILQASRLVEVLDASMVCSVFVAAIAHDLQHTGSSNVLLVSEGHEYARNAVQGVGPLESHHARCAVETLKRHGVLAKLPSREGEVILETVTTMIYATDAGRHKEVMTGFSEACSSFGEGFDASRFFVRSPQCTALLEVILKAADVSNPARSFAIASKWNERIYAEFYAEGDRDRAAGRKINPLHDRENNNISKSSVGFINFFVRGIFVELQRFLQHCEGSVVVRTALDGSVQALDDNAAAHQRLLDDGKAA